MLPLMQEGVERSRDAVRDAAIGETLARLDSLIEQRLLQAGKLQLKTTAALLSKQEQFQIAFNVAKSPEEKAKYEHYLTCLTWALDGHDLHPNESAAL